MENNMERLAQFNKKWNCNFQGALRWFESGSPLHHRPSPQVNKKNPPGLTVGWGKFDDSLSAWGPHVLIPRNYSYTLYVKFHGAYPLILVIPRWYTAKFLAGWDDTPLREVS